VCGVITLAAALFVIYLYFTEPADAAPATRGRFVVLIPFVAATIVCIRKFRAHMRAVRRHFYHGCATPAVVLSTDPPMIAVHTDLTKGDSAFPVIKVLLTRFGRGGDPMPQVGELLATVSVYDGRLDGTPHWSDFYPFPACTATSDVEEWNRVKLELPPEEWDALARGLEIVPQPYRPGIYPIPLVHPSPAAPGMN
jgi:hypothetical protein